MTSWKPFRTFNKEKFVYVGAFRTKTEANSKAKWERDRGYPARIVKGKEEHPVTKRLVPVYWLYASPNRRAKRKIERLW